MIGQARYPLAPDFQAVIWHDANSQSVAPLYRYKSADTSCRGARCIHPVDTYSQLISAVYRNDTTAVAQGLDI